MDPSVARNGQDLAILKPPSHPLNFNKILSSSVALDSTPLQRLEAVNDKLEELEESFIIKNRSFRQQFANLYFARLTQLKPAVLKVARNRWSSLPEQPIYVSKVLDVRPGKISYIVGTLFMDMPMKPNILDDITKERWIVAPPPLPKYISDKDRIALEDESGRVILTGNCLKMELLVTGIIISVLGSENAKGEFEVIDVCEAGFAEQPSRKLISDSENPKYIALISGLNIGGNKNELELQLLAEYLTGELGTSQDQNFCSKICRVIFVGNSLAEPKTIEDEKKPKKYGYDSSIYDSSPALQFDDILTELCSTIDIDIMPGKHDPANAHLPQQPIHYAMFPKSSQYSTFHSVTNPYWCSLDNTILLGTSGQTIDDMYKYVEGEDRLGLAKKTLTWRHIAPSAPDTLWCYPFQDQDPFILTMTPHIYFVGNQKEYATSLAEGPDGQKTRVIMVPSFSETSTIVIVNLSTLDCEPLNFETFQNDST